MSDDDTDSELDIDDEDLDDEEDLDDDDLDEEDLDADDDDDDVVVDDDDDDDDAPAAKAAADDDDDNDDDEDDLEADLDAILKTRLTSSEEIDETDDDEEEDQPPPRKGTDTPDGVSAKQEGEFTCSGCFIIVHPRQFGRRSDPVCPEGFEDCPSLKLVRKGS